MTPADAPPNARGQLLAADNYALGVANLGVIERGMRQMEQKGVISMRGWAGAMVAVLQATAGCAAVVPATVVPYSGGPAGPTDPASRGAEVYAGACAGCHGERGEGLEERPALIGDQALPVDPASGASARKVALTTAQDLFAFIKSDMPPIAPGSLDDDQYWAVVTYLVKANGVELQGQGIDPTNAGSIKLRR